MVGDRGGRQKASDKQEDQASLAPPVNVPKKGADTGPGIPENSRWEDLSEHFVLLRANRPRKRTGHFPNVSSKQEAGGSEPCGLCSGSSLFPE